MLQSRLFSKTSKQPPKDEAAINAQLLMRAGFIHKVMAGVYEYLPLGLRVLDKVNAIIREEMNSTGAEELHMSVLQSKETWMTTRRWETADDVMYKFKDASGGELALGWTHEEPLTEVAKRFISSYKDLPKAVYQIQTKFRNEPRAKSGLIRGKEFYMKDLYSFHTDEEDMNKYYEVVAKAYARIFKRVDLKAKRTLASGGLFSQFSDEYQVLCDAGEDIIFYCSKCPFTANREVADQMNAKDVCPKCGGELKQGKSVEVGNIFKLGTKFSEAFDLNYLDKNGLKHPVIMASYGIGPGRVMGTVIETHNDERGMIWPESIAPFKVHLLSLNGVSAKKEYEVLQKKGVEVLYDDRDVSAGQKFADADLIGIPWRLVKSPSTGAKIEVKKRSQKKASMMTLSQIIKAISHA